MVTLLAAVGGAVIGTWLFGLWRMVTEGQTAAKVIRYEILMNGAKVDLALSGMSGDLTLSDEGWRSHRLAIAPILRELEWFELCRETGFLPRAQVWFNALALNHAHTEARRELQVWSSDLSRREKVLADTEYRNRFLAMYRLLKRSRKAEEDTVIRNLISEQTTKEQTALSEAKQS